MRQVAASDRFNNLKTKGAGLLTQINARLKRTPTLRSKQAEEGLMPTEIAIIVAAIVLFFATFAGVLAWGDFYTRKIDHPGPAE